MYLVRKKKAKTAHLWTGFDTVCRMYSTGGLRKKSYQAVAQSDLPLCAMCAMCDTNSKKEIRPVITPTPTSYRPRGPVARFSDEAVQAAVITAGGQL